MRYVITEAGRDALNNYLKREPKGRKTMTAEQRATRNGQRREMYRYFRSAGLSSQEASNRR